MINALEAREKAKLRLDEIVSSQLSEIETLVLDACEKGNFYAFFDQDLKDETLKALADLGYNFKDEGDCKIIEWEFIETASDSVEAEDELFFNNKDPEEDSCEDCQDNTDSVSPETDVEEVKDNLTDSTSSEDFSFDENYDNADAGATE